MCIRDRINAAANALETSQRKLNATSRLTGIEFGKLRSFSEDARKELGLSTKQANEFTIAVSKLTNKAGDVDKTGDAISRLLDLAAAQGLNAEEALVAIQQAILGIDEGTDKLFQKNPSVIYAEYAKQIGTTAGKLNDQQKAQALLNAVMTDGLKVQGEYQNFLQSAAGRQSTLAVKTEQLAAKFGKLAQQIGGPVVAALTKAADFFINAPPWVRNLAAALGIATVALKLFGGAIQALFVSLGPVGWLSIALGTIATAFFALGAATEASRDKLAGYRKELDKFRETVRGLTDDDLKAQETAMRRQIAFLESMATNIRQIRRRALFGNADEKELQFVRVNRDVGQQLKEARDKLAAFMQETERRDKEHKAKLLEQRKQLSAEEKELEENRVRFEFEQGEISRAQYLAFLKKRQGDFKEWSSDWLGLHKDILEQEKALQVEQNAEVKRAADDQLALQMKIPEQMQFASEQALDAMATKLALMEDVAREKTMAMVEIIGTFAGNIGSAFADALRGDRGGFKEALKSILIDTLGFIQRFFILAKIKTIIEGVLNPFTALKSSAGLIAAFAALEAAKGAIARFAEGGIV